MPEGLEPAIGIPVLLPVSALAQENTELAF